MGTTTYAREQLLFLTGTFEIRCRRCKRPVAVGGARTMLHIPDAMTLAELRVEWAPRAGRTVEYSVKRVRSPLMLARQPDGTMAPAIEHASSPQHTFRCPCGVARTALVERQIDAMIAAAQRPENVEAVFYGRNATLILGDDI